MLERISAFGQIEDHAAHQCGPSGLMTCTHAGAGFSMKVLMEWQQVLPMPILEPETLRQAYSALRGQFGFVPNLYRMQCHCHEITKAEVDLLISQRSSTHLDCSLTVSLAVFVLSTRARCNGHSPARDEA